MNTEENIVQQYEEIFGKENRLNNLFPDEEDYAALRQEIIATKRETNISKTLPFDGVRLLSYEDYKRRMVVHEARQKGHRVFFIRKYEDSKLIAYAAGYYKEHSQEFVMLRETFFMRNSFYNKMYMLMNIRKHRVFRSSFSLEEGTLHLNKDMVCDSASLAASLVLGKRTTFREWHDKKGKTLDMHFSIYKEKDIDNMENKTFPDYRPPKKVSVEETTEVRENTAGSTVERPSRRTKTVRLFYIKRNSNPERVCDASGYYNPIDKVFILKAGSVLSMGSAAMFQYSIAGMERKAFIEKNCIKVGNAYKLKCDFTFDAPSSAASYVLGRTANGWTEWKDSNGENLDAVYRKERKS